MSLKRQVRRCGPADEKYFLIRAYAGALGRGGSAPAHAHDWDQLLAPESGVLSAWTGQGSWVAAPGWAVFAPAGVAHGMRTPNGARLRILYFKPGAFDASPKRSAVIAVSPLLRELITRAAETGMLDERDATHASIAHLIRTEINDRSAAPFELRYPKSAAFAALAEAVAAEPWRDEPQSTTARRLGLSLRTLQRGFLAETGLSLGAWRRQARFLFALGSLGAGASVKTVAFEAGYKSPSAFVAAFRDAFGVTPAKYGVRGLRATD